MTCNKSISAISMMVEGVRELAPELQEIVIKSLITVLNVCRLFTENAQKKRLSKKYLTCKLNRGMKLA